jgi:hypothetical protein
MTAIDLACNSIECKTIISGSQPAHNFAHDIMIQIRNAQNTRPRLLRRSGNALTPTQKS